MIKLFDDWIKSEERGDKPFLIMGKGPTINLAPNIDRNKYITLGLNHVVEKHKVDITHAIDYEVVKDAGHFMTGNAEYLLMPWYPNLGFRPHSKNLEELCKEDVILNRFRKAGKLLTYNRDMESILGANKYSPCPLGGIPINLVFFSGDSVFQLLAAQGEKNIFSLGLDGGKLYGEDFNGYIPLENGRDTFDDQFKVISHVSQVTGAKLIRIGELEPIKVFVGSQHEQYIPAKVLEYSIKKNTQNPVEFNLLYKNNIKYKTPDNPANRPRTPFSFQRFMIPSLTTGKAFYLDSDMQVFGDMAELLGYNFGEYDVLSCKDMDSYNHWKGSEYAVLMLDCDEISWDINTIVDDLDSGKLTYERLMFDFEVAKVEPQFPPSWNSLDTYDPNRTNLLHYTDMARQPWLYPGHPHEELWVKGLSEAIDAGVITTREYEEHVKNGFVRYVLKGSMLNV